MVVAVDDQSHERRASSDYADMLGAARRRVVTSAFASAGCVASFGAA